MRHVWVLAIASFMAACGSSGDDGSGSGSGSGSGFSCSAALEGTTCDHTTAFCSIEGNPGCMTPPTQGGCNCNSDNKWHCYCACYGPQTTCEVECPSASNRAGGVMCSQAGYQCTYADATCTCVDDGTGQGTFHFTCS